MGLVLVENLDGFALETERVGGEEEVFLPGESGANTQHGWCDLGELIVGFVDAQLAAQNQVRLEGGDGFEIELTRGAHSLYICQLIFEVSGLAGGVFRAGDADGSHAEAQNLVDFTAVENHDSLWLLLKGSFAA